MLIGVSFFLVTLSFEKSSSKIQILILNIFSKNVNLELYSEYLLIKLRHVY